MYGKEEGEMNPETIQCPHVPLLGLAGLKIIVTTRTATQADIHKFYLQFWS